MLEEDDDFPPALHLCLRASEINQRKHSQRALRKRDRTATLGKTALEGLSESAQLKSQWHQPRGHRMDSQNQVKQRTKVKNSKNSRGLWGAKRHHGDWSFWKSTRIKEWEKSSSLPGNTLTKDVLWLEWVPLPKNCKLKYLPSIRCYTEMDFQVIRSWKVVFMNDMLVL